MRDLTGRANELAIWATPTTPFNASSDEVPSERSDTVTKSRFARYGVIELELLIQSISGCPSTAAQT
jgi:hypothetical protein